MLVSVLLLVVFTAGVGVGAAPTISCFSVLPALVMAPVMVLLLVVLVLPVVMLALPGNGGGPGHDAAGCVGWCFWSWSC